MWPEFASLWPDLRAIGGDSVVLAGGYGLFLKQTWLPAHPEVPTIIPLARWVDSTPRGTNDFDFVVGVGLIASAELQTKVRALLAARGFKPKDPMWQFEKPLGDGRSIIVDIHAPHPADADKRVKVEQRRVKSKPSLGKQGLHGRADPESIGFDLYPFCFEMNGLLIATPNPVTWCSMKLAAMRDQHLKSENAGLSAAERREVRQKAIKHAMDVCRIAAMTTRDERDGTDDVIRSIHDAAPFKQAASIVSGYFQPEGWGSVVVESFWTSSDLQLIRDMLSAWFKEEETP
ncbi:MAG: hypothetical protein AB7T27_12135 [Kiritimatiellia bacterium]